MIPKDQLGNEITKARDKAEEGEHETSEDNQAQRDFGEVRNAQHRHVVQGVEVVFGDAAHAAFLVVEELLMWQADLGDLSAEVRLRVPKIALQNVDDLAIIEPEASEVLQHLYVRKPRDRFVVDRSNAVHKPVLIACALDCYDDGTPLLPFAEEVDDHLRGILQIREQNDYGITFGLKEGVLGRADVAEIARIDDYLDVGIVPGDATQNIHRAICRIVINDDVLVAILRQPREDLSDTFSQDFDIAFFVVAGTDDADELHIPFPLRRAMRPFGGWLPAG